MWIHLLPLELIRGASPTANPEPPQAISAGGWVEYRKPPKKKKELLITGAPQTVAEVKKLPQRVSLPPQVDVKAVQAVSAMVEVVKATAAEYNAKVQRQRREEEELLLMF